MEGSGEYSAVPMSSGEALPSDSGGSNGSGSDDEQLVPLVPEVAARHRRQAAQVRKLTWWRILDEKWIKPTFGGNLERSSDTMPHAHPMGSGSSHSSGLPQRQARGGSNSNHSNSNGGSSSSSSSSPANGSNGGNASAGNGSSSGDGKKGSRNTTVSYSSLPSSASTHLRKQFSGGDDDEHL